MHTPSFVANRIVSLKGLHVQWATELQHLVHVDSDRAFHLAEALQDLTAVISALETSPTHRSPTRSRAPIARYDG